MKRILLAFILLAAGLAQSTYTTGTSHQHVVGIIASSAAAAIWSSSDGTIVTGRIQFPNTVNQQ